MQFLLPILLLVGMMIFMNRSQKKQQKQRQDLLGNMKIGDKVVTIGGLHGVISEIDTQEKTVTIDCEGIYLEFNRSAIASVKPNEVVEEMERADIVEEVANEDEEVSEVTKNVAEDEPEETKETEDSTKE